MPILRCGKSPCESARRDTLRCDLIAILQMAPIFHKRLSFFFLRQSPDAATPLHSAQPRAPCLSASVVPPSAGVVFGSSTCCWDPCLSASILPRSGSAVPPSAGVVLGVVVPPSAGLVRHHHYRRRRCHRRRKDKTCRAQFGQPCLPQLSSSTYLCPAYCTGQFATWLSSQDGLPMATSWTDALQRTHLKQLQQPLPRQVRRFSSASIEVSNARQVWTSRETQPAAPTLHLKREANSAMRQVSLRIGKESHAAMRSYRNPLDGANLPQASPFLPIPTSPPRGLILASLTQMIQTSQIQTS
jgi:hypothetical protein